MVLQKAICQSTPLVFCRAMFIDMADKQPITAQRKPMLTRPFFQDGRPPPLKISWTNNTITKNEANVSDPEKHMFLHAFYDALCNYSACQRCCWAYGDAAWSQELATLLPGAAASVTVQGLAHTTTKNNQDV